MAFHWDTSAKLQSIQKGTSTMVWEEIPCFLGRTEKSLENIKWSQAEELRPESYVKEMAMETKS